MLCSCHQSHILGTFEIYISLNTFEWKTRTHTICYDPGHEAPRPDRRMTRGTPSTSALSSPSPTSSRSHTRRAWARPWEMSRRRATAGQMSTTWARTPSTSRWCPSTRVPQVRSDFRQRSENFAAQSLFNAPLSSEQEIPRKINNLKYRNITLSIFLFEVNPK